MTEHERGAPDGSPATADPVREFDRVDAALSAIGDEYLRSRIDHSFEVGAAFPSPAGTEPAGRIDDRTRRVVALLGRLTEASPLGLSFDRLSALADDATDPWSCRFTEHACSLAAVLTDAARIYPDLDAREAVSAWNSAVGLLSGDGSRRAAAGSLRAAANHTYRVATTIRRAHDALALIEDCRFATPDDTPERSREALRGAVTACDPDRVTDLQERLAAVLAGEWTVEHCLAFDPYEFEHLVADLWAERRNTTSVTQASQDKGIDVIVRRPNGRTLLLQAKRYRPGNTVGIVEVQRTAGLLVEFPAARVLLVTSSSFTESARDSGETMEQVELVDGDRLTDMLTASSLAPPLLD
jgi:hypothetical protein